MKWSFLANYCCERGRGGAFCASHKQSFLPLVPGYWEGYISRAGWVDRWMDGWSGEEQSGALAVIQLTSRLVLQDLSYDFTHGARSECVFFFFLIMSFSTSFLRLWQKSRNCKISVTLIGWNVIAKFMCGLNSHYAAIFVDYLGLIEFKLTYAWS